VADLITGTRKQTAFAHCCEDDGRYAHPVIP